MTVAAPFPSQPPRAPDAELLTRSLKRPTLGVWLFGGLALIASANIWIAGTTDLFFTIETLALLLPSAYTFVRFSMSLRRLRAIWRSGVRADVVLQRSLYFWTRAYRYRVELDDGRWATVILGSPANPGTKLPALVCDDLIAVSDFGGCLKTGRLRRASQTAARVAAKRGSPAADV